MLVFGMLKQKGSTRKIECGGKGGHKKVYSLET